MHGLVIDDCGTRYRVRIAPMQECGFPDVSPQLNALVFETKEGECACTVPVYHTLSLEYLPESELLQLLDEAMRRG